MNATAVTQGTNTAAVSRVDEPATSAQQYARAAAQWYCPAHFPDRTGILRTRTGRGLIRC